MLESTPRIDVEATLARMTLQEKILATSGKDFWHLVNFDKLGIPSVRCSDGPNGVRGQTIFNGTPASCFPAGTSFGSMFDPDLLYRIGQHLGKECRAKGVHVLLGPTVNMQRHPFGGRAFESIAEDPHLSGTLAAAYVKGLQSSGVGACIKHLVANDQEHDRFASDSRISQRALREIYLEPFRLVCRDGKPKTMMTAYNKCNGDHCSSSVALLKNIVRDEWGYDGLIMSDWSGIYTLRESYEATLDLEMPGPGVVRGTQQVLRAINGGDVSPRKHLDPIVRRYLNLVNWAIDSGIPFNARESSLDDPSTSKLLRECAAASVVVLKNERNLLPLRDTSFSSRKRLAILGNNAGKALGLGGGSSALLTTYNVTPLQGLSIAAQELGVSVKHVVGAPTHVLLPLIDAEIRLPDDPQSPGLLVELFADKPPSKDWMTSVTEAGEDPFMSVGTQSSSIMLWDGLPEGMIEHDIWARVRTCWTPSEAGNYELGITCIGNVTLFVDRKPLITVNEQSFVQGEHFFGFASEEVRATLEGVEAGRTYALEIRLEPSDHLKSLPWTVAGAIRIGAFKLDSPEKALVRAEQAAMEADVAVVVVGLSPEHESEGFDRKTLDLPGDSDELIGRVLAVQPNTIVVNQSGTPVTMPWAAEAPAIVQAFYGGNEAGNGLADVLFGKHNPSGRLPLSFPRRQGDIAAQTSFGVESEEPHAVHYNEGIFVGYRNYEKRNISVLFPFGHGLSYSKFEYNEAKLDRGQGAFGAVCLVIKNASMVDGQETVQLYVHHRNPQVARPEKELKMFRKVAVKAGGEEMVTFQLDKECFSYFNAEDACWSIDAGDYELLIGASSADIRRRLSYVVDKTQQWLAILGSGWAGYRILQKDNKNKYDVSLISPIGYFNFTPLLAGAAVGTLEFRCATEPSRRYAKQAAIHEAWAENIDLARKQITCIPATKPPEGMEAEKFRQPFKVDYDKLVICVGAYSQTFGTPGVKENATFLKDIADARTIRSKIVECFEQASQPNMTDSQRRGLLHFAIVGGGPTGIELAAELHNLCTTDMPRYYPEMHKFHSITIYEVSDKILAAFDNQLQNYASERFKREGIQIRSQHHVEKVEPGKLFVKEQGEVACGMIVWSTGLALSPLVEALQGVSKTQKALLADPKLHLLDDQGLPMPDVWAIGDCAMVEDVAPLPATAQVANQKAFYVTKTLNDLAKGKTPTEDQFSFKDNGSLAYLGDWKALYDKSKSGGDTATGSAAFLLWRSAYFATTLSIRNKILVPFFWFMNWAFGRNIARF